MTDSEKWDVQQLINAAKKLTKSHALLMPGVAHIPLQDYALPNDAPLEVDAAIRTLETRLQERHKP